MFEIIGFIGLAALGVLITLTVIFSAIFEGWVSGTSIGGRYPTVGERVFGIFLIVAVIVYWYWMYTVCPFEIIIKQG